MHLKAICVFLYNLEPKGKYYDCLRNGSSWYWGSLFIGTEGVAACTLLDSFDKNAPTRYSSATLLQENEEASESVENRALVE